MACSLIFALHKSVSRCHSQVLPPKDPMRHEVPTPPAHVVCPCKFHFWPFQVPSRVIDDRRSVGTVDPAPFTRRCVFIRLCHPCVLLFQPRAFGSRYYPTPRVTDWWHGLYYCKNPGYPTGDAKRCIRVFGQFSKPFDAYYVQRPPASGQNSISICT